MLACTGAARYNPAFLTDRFLMSDQSGPGAPLAHFALMPGAAPAKPSLEETLRAAVGGAAANLRFPEPPRPAIPAAPQTQWPEPSPELVAARREWLLGQMDTQRRMSAKANSLAKRRNLSGDEFLDEFYAQHRPVVLEGVAAEWPAVDKWSAEYLAQAVGDAPVQYQGERTSAGDFELAKDRHLRTMPFDAFVAMVCDPDTPRNDAYITAYNDATNAAAFAPLQADLGTLGEYLTPGAGMMWVGPEGTFTPLHFDLTNNLLVQLCGLKEVTLIPPSQTRFMYHTRHVFSEVHDIDDPERLAAFPLARLVTPYEVILEPGDALYIPVGWWHQVRSLEFSAMLTYTNFRWPNLGYESYPEG